MSKILDLASGNMPNSQAYRLIKCGEVSLGHAPPEQARLLLRQHPDLRGWLTVSNLMHIVQDEEVAKLVGKKMQGLCPVCARAHSCGIREHLNVQMGKLGTLARCLYYQNVDRLFVPPWGHAACVSVGRAIASHIRFEPHEFEEWESIERWKFPRSITVRPYALPTLCATRFSSAWRIVYGDRADEYCAAYTMQFLDTDNVRYHIKSTRIASPGKVLHAFQGLEMQVDDVTAAGLAHYLWNQAEADARRWPEDLPAPPPAAHFLVSLDQKGNIVGHERHEG